MKQFLCNDRLLNIVNILDNTVAVYFSHLSHLKYLNASSYLKKHSCFRTSLIPNSPHSSFFLFYFHYSEKPLPNDFPWSYLRSLFRHAAIDHGNCTDVYANLFAEPSGALAAVGIEKLSGVDVTGYEAFHETLHDHKISSMFATDIVVIRCAQLNDNFAFLSSFNQFQCGKTNEVPSTLCKIRPSVFYASSTQVITSQSAVQPSGRDLLSPANLEKEVTELAITHNYDTFEATGTIVQVKNLMLPIIVTRIRCSEAIRLPTLGFHCAI